MIRNLLLASVLLHYAALLYSQDIQLAAVPDSLSSRASVVVHYENIVFDIKDVGKAVEKVRRIYTVVSEEGKSELVFATYTNTAISLQDVDLKVYDSKGKQILRYRDKDVGRQATGEGLVDDGYLRYIEVPAPTYPLTIDLEYERLFKGTLTYPQYQILSPGHGLVESSFTAKVPISLDLRYKNQKTDITPEVSVEGKYKIYKWSARNIPPFSFEYGAVESSSAYPAVILAPNRFRIYDTDGEMTSWAKFGEWEQSLLPGLDNLTEERKAFYQALVKDVPTDREKVKKVYEHLQKNFRYVSIQLGIGGFKPFDAKFTDEKKYGDCKGLSFLMHAILKSLNIKSHLALINSGSTEEPVDPSFVCNRFNHAIICAPLKGDTVWIDCTSNTLEFGNVGVSNENRNALLITDKGGVLVSTPGSRPESNTFYSYTRIKLNADGSGKSSSTISTSGEYLELQKYLFKQKGEDQKKILVYALGFKPPNSFLLKQSEESNNKNITLQFDLDKVPDLIAGNKMFLRPRIQKVWDQKLPSSQGRKQDYFFDFPFIYRDTTVYLLPEGFKKDALPTNQTLACEFAAYQTKYWYHEGSRSLFTVTELVLKQYRVPASGYEPVKTFFDKVMRDDGQRIVVIR
jgi:hypothetical protein